MGKHQLRLLRFAIRYRDYHEWRNDFLTAERFGEYHGLTKEEAQALIYLMKEIASHPHPDE